jgi:peptidoglycan L-alanyl-D-glutamate endopeptidase CwlK
MPSLSASSQARLDGAHPLLKKLFLACAADPACPPFAVLDGQRGRQAQEKAFALKHSKAHFGQSAHNWQPAVAVDVVPYPIDWTKLDRFKALGAFVTTKARALGIDVNWGGGWKSFKDYPHYELSNWRDLVALKKVRPFDG